MARKITELQYLDLDKLKKHPNNPRAIKNDSFKKLMTSIDENPDFFEARPIMVSDRTGELIIIGGNQRYAAAKELGFKQVPVIVMPALTEEKEKEIMIRDNIANGEWDYDKLANEWDAGQLNEWGLDVPDWDKETANAGLTDPDDVPEPEENPVTVQGDLWVLGDHRLLCGSSAEEENQIRVLNGRKIDLVFTDPPYGVSIGKKNVMLNSFQPSGRNLRDIVADDMKPEDLKKMLVSVFTSIKKHSQDHCVYYVCSPQNGELGMMIMMMMMESGLLVRHVLNWIKNSPTFSMNRLDYDYQHEPILYTWNKKHNHKGQGAHKTSCWFVDKPRESKLHPTMKPVELVENAILNSSSDGDLLFEPFSGSGTAFIAAEKTGRVCYGLEYEAFYTDVIIKRWQDFSGKIAVLESTGQTFEEVKAERHG